MSGFDVKRKRPWWFGWIPAAVLLVLMAGVVVTVVVVQASGLGKPLPKPTVGQVNDLNWSSFSQDGLDYIDRSRNIRIDLSRPPVMAADIDLPDDGATTVGPTRYDDRDNDYYVIINGGGEGNGGTKLTVSQVTITTEGGLVTEVASGVESVLPFRNALDKLSGQAGEFGWTALDTSALFTDWVETTGAGATYSVTIGPGTRLGFGISATITCDPQAPCGIEYSVVPRVG